MDRPVEPPNPENLDRWAAAALDYLRTQLRANAPDMLGPGIVFAQNPLEGEGPIVIFPFRAEHGASPDNNYHVVVGLTEPNYYPAYGLNPEEVCDLHLGTRFMLVMQVAQRQPTPEDDFEPQREARRLVDRVAPQEPIEDLTIAACFDVEGQLHVVLKCRIRGDDCYLMAGDAPPGFSLYTNLPAPVAYRIHIGRVLRSEPRPTEDDTPAT